MKNILRNVTIFLAVYCAAIIGVTPLFASVTYENSLVGYWNFDDGSGTTAGDATGANDGTLVSNPVWTTGMFGGALNFDGADDYVRLTSSTGIPTGNSNFTLSAWVKREGDGTAGGARDMFIAFGEGQTPANNYAIKRCVWLGNDHTSGALSFGTGGSDNFGITPMATDEWTHIAAAYNGSNVDIYKNGSFVTSLTYSNLNIVLNDGILRIGAQTWNEGEKYNGTIDDVAIWNRPLDTDEISSIYNIGIQGFEGLLDGVTTTFGDLGYTSDQVAQLTQLYADGKASQPVEELDLGDGITWDYLDGNLPGDTGGAVYDIGDSWIYEGKYYIKLGSGLVGNPLGSVPEIPAGAIPFIGTILCFGLKRTRWSFQ